MVARSRAAGAWARILAPVDAAALRAEFPGLADRAYLNAGTCGPLPSAALRAAREVLERAGAEGRPAAYFEAQNE